MKRIVIGISGATGVIYGIRLLEVLKNLDVETHLILSDGAKKNIEIESSLSVREIEGLATTVHDSKNVGASVASGSFKTDGMVIVPCSIRTLSGLPVHTTRISSSGRRMWRSRRDGNSCSW